ncbi:unnamed protein product [Paramecium pentaurelia]|uniref:PH domain-containing protein n=1 Tax=Paramecium pentaurelia TaxID=43138 RepID=A0A8S1VRJ5_9CILI|nr:unnamed protein product [Paramecium pentaurelia]
MFSFKPVKWFSSLLLSKFLKPYIKNFESQNIDVQILDGEVCLKQLELRNDILMQFGIDIEVIDSSFGEVKLIIPWNNLKTKEISVEITNAKIVLSNKIEMSDFNKEQYKDHLEKLKREVLAKFDETVQKEDAFSNGSSGNNFFAEFAMKIFEKFVLKINNLDIVFIYQINNYEIVKFGFGFQTLVINQDDIKPKKDEIRKKIVADNIFLLFEVFDNVLPSQLQPESFIRDQNQSKQEEKKAVHILKKLALKIEFSLVFSEQMEIELKIATISDVLIYLKQRQIRLLLRAMQDIVNHRNDRPKEKPKYGKTAKNWWIYIIRRVIEKEYIKTKVRKQGITNYFKVQQYIELYTKKMLKQHDIKRDNKLMGDFEQKNTISQILILRSIAIDKILEMRNILRSNNPRDQKIQKEAQGWFKTFQNDFNMEHASNLKFSRNVIDSYLSFMKEKESNTRISIILDVKKINLLIQENQILQQLRNLHQQVNIFKQELNQKKSLQTKVLDHIKNNFLQKITKVTVKSSEIDKQEDWKLDELLKEKILINLEITETKLELVKQGQFKQLMKAQIQKLILLDTNKFNSHYLKIVEISEGIKVLMSSEQLERQKKILDLDPLEKTIQVYLDIQVGPLSITLCKPLYERLISLQNLIFFDKSTVQNDNQDHSKYFDNFLILTKRVQSNTNVSFSIRRINIYLPLQYQIKTQMLLIHLKQIKIFKREHENSVVNIYQAENSNGQVSQYLKDLKTRQTVNRVAKQNQNQEENQNLKPVYFSVDCLRLAFVQDYDWENKENIFKIQYRKLRKNEQQNGDPGIETIIETLPIKIRMEQSQKMITLESNRTKSKSKMIFKKKIYPKTSMITIQLPFLDFKLSTKHLYLILQLVSIWQTKGYDFYDVIESKVQKQEHKQQQQYINEDCQEQLKDYMISQLQIDMEGLQLSVTVNTQEFLEKLGMRSCHENRLFSFYFLNLNYLKELKFYDSIQHLAIQELALQNINCHSYQILVPLKVLAKQLLKYSDCEKEQRKSSFGEDLERVMNQQSEIEQVGNSKLNENKSNIKNSNNEIQHQQQDNIDIDNDKELKGNEIPPDELQEDVIPQTIFSQKKGQFQIPSPQHSFLDNKYQEAFESELYIKEYFTDKQCLKCKEKHRLLLTFMKVQDDLGPDVYFLQTSDSQRSRVSINLKQLNLILDPDIITKMRQIFDIGNLAAEVKKQQFTKWMRENGFWPDFNEVDQKQQQEAQTQTTITSDLFQETNRIELEINQIVLMLNYKDQVVYLMNMKFIDTQISSSKLFKNINIKMQQVKLFDTAVISGIHRTMLEDYDDQNENQVQCQIQICNNSDLIKIRKYATYCGVRIQRAKIVFLKRNTNEIQYYLRKVLIKSFSSTLTNQDRNELLKETETQNLSFETQPKDVEVDSEFGFRFSLVALDSLGIGYRSSLSNEALYIQFKKVGYWFSGIWGQKYDNLIKTGLFDDEIEEQQNISENFVEAKYSQEPTMAEETIFEEINNNQQQDEENIDQRIRQIVYVWGLEIRCCPGTDVNDLFVKAPEDKVSLQLFIDFCDETPDKLFCDQEAKPMRITIDIQKLNIYAYDLDYCTICKFFMDNLGEQPQTIKGDLSGYSEFNENIWMVLDININKAIAKFFKGTREDCRNHYLAKGIQQDQLDKNLLYKNPASIAIAKLQTLNYQFMMRENGGKFMRLSVQQLTLSDFRKSSTMKHSKEILFSLIGDQFKGDEDQSMSDTKQEEFNKIQANLVDDLDVEQVDQELNKKEKEKNKQIQIEQQIPNSALDSKDNQLEQDLQSQASQLNKKQRKQNMSKWQTFVTYVKKKLCCSKRKKKLCGPKSKNKSQQENMQNEKEQQQLIQAKLDQLLEYSPEPMFQRRWLNFRERQVLPITIENNNHQDDKDDYDYYFGDDNHDITNQKPQYQYRPYQQQKEDQQKQDLYFIMKTKPDGEKLIKIKLENKNIILLIDFIVEVVQFFRQPYNGSDKQPYQRNPPFNNFPPMVIEINVVNVWAIVLGDLEKETFEKSKSIGILLDCNYSQTWLGDSWFGPGSCEKNIEATLKKLYIFQTNHIINLKQDEQSKKTNEKIIIQPHPPLRTLLEPFKVCIKMKYSVDFYRNALKNQEMITEEGVYIKDYYTDYNWKKKSYQSKNEWEIYLINSTRLKNNFSLSIRDIAELQQIINIFSSRKSPEDKYVFKRKPQPPDPFIDDCINTKKINIEMLKIQILKNKDGVKAAQFELKDLRMSDFKDNKKTQLNLLACISLDYFNKRKMDFEPFLEPWKFTITTLSQIEKPPENRAIDRDSKKFTIANHIEKELKGEEVPYYLKDHTNSLNINITPALVEVAMEALKIYNKKMEDEEPYKIFNRCGYALEIRDIKKDQYVRIINEDQEYTCNTQKELWAKDFKKHKSDQQQMLLNLVVLKPNNQKERDDEEDEIKIIDSIHSNNNRRTTLDYLSKSTQSKPLIQQNQTQTLTQNYYSNMNQSQYTKSRKQLRQSRNEKNISNYKTLKYVNFDFVGKKFYPLIRQHKNEQQDLHSGKKGTFDAFKTNIDKITGVFLADTKKINEERNIYIQVNVNINPQNGSKEIQIQSTVKIYNYLSTSLELGFQVNGQMKETTSVKLEPKQIYIVPLEFLENKTEVRFTPEKIQNRQQDEQLERKYYQLDTLLCDQQSLGEFEVDKDNSIVEVLEQATQIVTSQGKSNSVIKSEFKQIHDPLNYKYDHIITSMKSNIKRNNFYFIINCVKIKNQITNQRKAMINFNEVGEQKPSEDDNDVCYETYLICYPIFKFTNATVRDINIHYGVFSSNKQQSEKQLPYSPVQPDQHFYCETLDYHDDIEVQFSIENQQKFEEGEAQNDEIIRTKPFKIFNRGFGLGEENKLQIKFKQQKGNNQYLTVLIKKRSTKSRELVLYCPYLIFNETNKLLIYREYGLTQDILSNDWIYYQNFSKTYQKNKQKKEIEQHSQYHNLHQFATSTNMNKIQVAIGQLNDQQQGVSEISKWSNPVSLQNSNVIEIIGSTEILKKDHEQLQSKDRKKRTSADAKGKFEFGMAIASGPGSFHRSKLITITPRFIVHNETQYNIAMVQVDTEYRDNNLLRLKPGDWKYFSWSNIKKPALAMISFYQESTGLISGWSGYFKLQVQEISLKIPSIKPIINNNNSDYQQLYVLQKVNITLMDDLILLIRFILEDPIIPPYYIDNQTKYEITYKQQPSSQAQRYKLNQANPMLQNNEINRGIHQVIESNPVGSQDYQLIQFSAGGNEVTYLQPGEKVAFTWDHWIDDKEHVLEVEIEGQTEKYEIDKIQNFQPLTLPGQSQKRKKIVNKKYLYKQGNILIKDLDKPKEYYCTLNVLKQKFNVYSSDKKQHESYYLQGAKVDESKDNEFVLKINPEKMLSKNLHFQTKTVDEANQWVEYLWRAILIDKPEMVELKIEPSNQTKVVTFFQNQSNDRADSQKEGSEILQEKEDDTQNQQFTCYKISISNCVGISIIDETPKEILQICFKNIQAEYILIEEIQKDLQLRQNQDEDENTNLLAEKPQIKQIKEHINLSIDLIIINNQIINSQFPVLLAPNKKKIFGNQQPFFVLTTYRKDQQQIKKSNASLNNGSRVVVKNESNAQVNQIQANDQQQNQSKFKISYIHTLQMFTDTLEIRLDHQILDQIIQYYNLIAAIIWDSNFSDVQQQSNSQFGLGSLQKKQEEQLKKIKQHSISKIYLKNLMLEPIDICFTLKSSPGHVMNSSSIGVIADLGLTLASIDSAKIRLNAFKTQHIFGSSNEIIGRISKHYKGQFLTQIYKLLGSFEIFGNPVSLISNLGTGVIDMFYEPIYALVTGKSGYKVGEKFFTGAVTLIHTSITGVYKTVNTIIGTIMKILDQMTLDKKYMSERSNRLNRAIKNFREGLIIGFTNFGKILFQTIIGVLERPITGINDGGFLGFLLGIYQGIMGIIIKPTVGIYDLLITIIEGIKNTAIYEEHIMDTRYRPPRIFGDNNQLIPFNFKHAIGTDIIRRFKLKVIDGESIIFFDQLNISDGQKKKQEAQIVLTDSRIVYVLSHSSIHCDKIMIYKIKSMKYKEQQKLLEFKLHTPVRKSWFQTNSKTYSLKYESKIKAIKLAEQIQKSFKDRYNIKLRGLKEITIDKK